MTWLTLALLALAMSACKTSAPVTGDAGAAPNALPTVVPVVAKRLPPTREGGALVRSIDGDFLYVADEDHHVVRVVPLPVAADKPPVDVKLPGAPAQVLAFDGVILVTVRDPGLLVIMKPDAAAGLVETARVAVPADAWGVAVTPDAATALVTSAWTHHVSAVQIASGTRLWSVDVAREPRGVVVKPGGGSA